MIILSFFNHFKKLKMKWTYFKREQIYKLTKFHDQEADGPSNVATSYHQEKASSCMHIPARAIFSFAEYRNLVGAPHQQLTNDSVAIQTSCTGLFHVVSSFETN